MTRHLALQVEELRLLNGCSAGLAEPTAVVRIAVEGEVGDGAFDRMREGVGLICPEELLFGVSESDWPTGFLVEPSGGWGGDGQLLAQWVVALTVALQRWARDPVWFGRVIGVEPKRLRVAIPWRRPGVLNDTLRLALRLLELWSQPPNAEQRTVGRAIGPGMTAARAEGLSPHGLRFIQAAVERGIPFHILPSCVQFGFGEHAMRMDSTLTGQTRYIATAIAKHKAKTARVLADAGIPVPRGEVAADFVRAVQIAEELGWPVVVKPVDQDRGIGVVPHIGDDVALRVAFDAAAAIGSGNVLVEKHVFGDDHRFLVVHGRLLAAARRIPGGVTGDGIHTVGELVDLVNADPRRSDDPRGLLKTLRLDDVALGCLAERDVQIDSVPDSGDWIQLRRTANICSGGTSEDVTAMVHPDNRLLAERAARLVGLDIAGVDFLSSDISRSWREVGGAICEVNDYPGLRPHWLAQPQRDINGEIIDLAIGGRPTRIPTAAITGTNGKSTTALMLHHIWTTAGKVAGVCTTQAVRIGEEIVSTDNLSGFPGARIILNDPAVQAGVFEMPRKGLIYFGHPCDRYDVAALLNVQDDHIGVDGIETLEQMADLKAEVLQRAAQAVVANAEDPLCLAMLARAGTDRRILVARNPAAVAEHRASRGEAVFLDYRDDEPWIMLGAGHIETPLMPAAEIPATMSGLLQFNETNAMFAAALAWAQGIDTETIRRALGTFHNSAEQNPGRYNFFGGLLFTLMLDYGHNPAGVREVCAVAAALPVTGRRMLCAINFGNRHYRHFVEVGRILADSFDEFVIGCDSEIAQSHSAATALAAKRNVLLDNGVACERITTEPDPRQAAGTALSSARAGDLLVVLADPEVALPVIDEFIGIRD